MRTFISVVLVTTIVLSATAAWAKTQVAVSLYPVYLLAQGVIDANNIELVCLQKSGDTHDLSLSAKDITKLKNTKLLITNGLGLDEQVVLTIKKAWPNIKVLNVSKDLSVIKALNEHENEHEHESAGEHKHESGHKGHHHGLYDPHVWLGLDNTRAIQKAIATEMIRLEPGSKTKIQSNLKKAAAQIDKLQALINTSLKGRNIRLIAFHSAWAYFERSTGIKVVESLSVNPDTEPSAQRIREIIKIARSKKVNAFVVETGMPDKAIRTLVKEVKLPVIELNPLDTVSNAYDFQHYIDAMTKNISVLATLK